MLSDKNNLIIQGLIELRKSKSMSQYDLAIKINKLQSYVSKVELGNRKLSVIELVEYLKPFDKKVDEFLKDILNK